MIELGGGGLARQVAVGGAKRSLHDSARVAEDDARAGAFAHQAVKGALGELGKIDAGGLGPVGELDGRDDVVGVTHGGIAEQAARGVHLLAQDLGLLGRAGRHRHVHDALWVEVHLLREVGLDGRTLHADGALRGGDVRNHFGMEGLAVADPGGAAARELGQRTLGLGDALDELGSLLADRKVGGEVRVEDVVAAEAAQELDHLSLDEGAVGHAEGVAERHAHRRARREDHDLVGIRDGLPDGVAGGLDLKGVGRADGNALSAVDADGSSARLGKIVGVVDADILVADAGAEAAFNAEILVADNGGIVLVDGDANLLPNVLGHTLS